MPKRSSRGISPIFAAVLIVGLTMMLAAILALYASNLISHSPAEEGTEQTQCQNIAFDIASCKYQSSMITLVLENLQIPEVKNPIVTIFDKSGVPLPAIKLNSSISSGATGGFSTYSVPVSSSDFTKIVVGTELCPEVKQETTCDRI